MSSITTNLTQCTIGTLNQYNEIDGKYVDQQITRIKNINNCDEPIDSFTGRGTQLSDLYSKFNKHNIVVIHGVGGVGKTQLARKFAADNKNNYNCLFWIQSEFQEKLLKLLRELAIALAIEDAKDKNINQIRNDIYDILKTQRALLIFDNVLNKADIIEYLPPVSELKNTKLHILITSQFLDWNNKIVECLKLTHLEEFQALELLNKIFNTNREKEKDRKKLVLMLEYMPLAIQIAASYINTQMKQNDAFTITRYTEKLTNDIANIHIEMSLNIIREDNSYAMELVYIMAFFNPDSITKEVLLKILKINGNDAKDDFCEALQIIINYSLISSFNNILHLHRDIQEIVRNKLMQLDTHIFLKYYELVLDYVLINEDQNSIRNTYVFNYAKDYTKFILQYYKTSKSTKLLQLLCEHGCLKNVKVIFTALRRNKVNLLIEQHGLLHCATLSSDIETVKIICKYNIDVNMKYGFDETTSLHIACKHGYVDITDFLIEKGADSNMKCENGRIALHYASSGLHYDIVQRLLHISTDTVEERDKKNQTPLHLVLNTHKINENNDETLQIARLLIEKGANPDTANDDSYKVIHIAAHNGNYDFLAYLLHNYGLDVNAKNIHGNTPLLHAAAACKLIPVDHMKNTMKLLIKNGADIEAITNNGRSLLHVAAQNCHFKIIFYLIQEHNISVDTPDSNGETPLFRAMLASKSMPDDDIMATVMLLIENKADVETIINNGRSLLHFAAEFCHFKIISYLIQEHNISVDTPDNNGETPLFRTMLASKSIPEDDVMATVKLLIENKASVETITNNGRSLLHIAAEFCHFKIISYLIQEHNIAVDIPDNNGETPLFRAMLASKSIPEDDVMATVKLLIEHKADVKTIINNGRSLLHVAAEFCHYKIISYLIQEHNIFVDTPDNNSETPLYHAMFASKSIPEEDVMATFKLLIENGASLETITNNGRNLLHIAAEFCHYKIISYLFQEYNISVDTPDNNGETPLFRAMLASKSIPKDNVMATVMLLIENEAKVETINNDGCSLLHVASQYCNDRIIPYLIQKLNICIDTPDNDGDSPLFCATAASKSISEGDVIATVKLLIKNGANVEMINNVGCNLLHVAAKHCRDKIISYLIQEHNISVDTPNNSGESPLFSALLTPNSVSEDDILKTIKVLIEMGARVDILDIKGNSLFHIAADKNLRKIMTYLFNNHKLIPLLRVLLASEHEDKVMKMIELLAEKRAHMGTTYKNGTGLLHVTARYGCDKIILHLIQKYDLPVTITDSLGRSPLFCALKAYRFVPEEDVMETIKLLIDQGSTVEATDNTGCTILHYAALFGHHQALTYLLHNYNININTKDEDGDTPLHCALIADESINQKTVKKIINTLLSKGASINLKNNKDQTALDLASAEIRKFMQKSYTKVSKRRIPEITQHNAKRRKN